MRKRINQDREQKAWCYGHDLRALESLTRDGEQWQFVQCLVDDKIGDCFLVSSTGRVFDCDKQKFRKQYLDDNIDDNDGGYLCVSFPQCPKSFKNYKSHRLVALAFVVNPDPEHRTEAHHINGIRTDNRAANLLWVSRSEHRALHVLKENDELQYWMRIAELRKEQPIRTTGKLITIEALEEDSTEGIE